MGLMKYSSKMRDLTIQAKLCWLYQVQAVVLLFAHLLLFIDTIAGIVNASISLVFLISNGNVKMFLKIMGREKIGIERLLYWPEVN